MRSGKLERSVTAVEEIRINSRHRMVPFGYEVEIMPYDVGYFDRDQDYSVRLDHGHPAKLPQDVLHARVLQTASIPMKHAFDIDLDCLNGLFRGCRFDELAPWGWADYTAKAGDAGASQSH